MKSTDEKIAQMLWRDILQLSLKPFAWHFEFNSIQTITRGTKFRVAAKFITGWVEIQQEHENLFAVNINPDNYNGKLTYESVSSQNLVSVIDRVLTEGVLCDNSNSQEYRIAV